MKVNRMWDQCLACGGPVRVATIAETSITLALDVHPLPIGPYVFDVDNQGYVLDDSAGQRPHEPHFFRHRCLVGLDRLSGWTVAASDGRQ